MCGIAGVVSQTSETGKQYLRDALVRMNHRGPDGEGVFGNDGKGIGMCRLRIRSLNSELVPFRRDNACHALNGEVYRVLREGKWVAINGGPDEACALLSEAQFCDGMWALASLVDDQIEVRRDPWGIKPLWILHDWDGVRIASEIAPLVTSTTTSVRAEGIAQFLTLGQVIDGGTVWEGIESIPPGATSIEERQGVGPTDLLRIAYPEVATIVDTYVETRSELVGSRLAATVRELIGESVEICIDADRPIGLAVSGGLDSSILRYHLEALGISAPTISIEVPEYGDGIGNASQLEPTAFHSTGNHGSRALAPSEYFTAMRECVLTMSHPTSLTSAPLYFALAELARERGITVLLVGEGADEIWGGYTSYLTLQSHRSLFGFYVNQHRARLAQRLLGKDRVADALTALKRRLYATGQKPTLRSAERWMSLEPLLWRTDALTMRFSIEARTPFLHGSAWSVAEALPWEEHVAGEQTKRFLRQAYATVLPMTSQLPKRPFRAPFSTWLTGPLAGRTHELLSDCGETFAKHGIRPDIVLSIHESARRGSQVAADLTYSLCSLAIWLREVANA